MLLQRAPILKLGKRLARPRKIVDHEVAGERASEVGEAWHMARKESSAEEKEIE